MGIGSSKMSEFNGVTIPPKGQHTATVIFLHGLGDTGHGWAAGFQTIKADHIKYLFPNAETSPVSLNMGMMMPSWFDIKSLNFGGDEDAEGIRKSSKFLESLIEKEEKAGIALNRIVIGGFSQGGAVALHSAFFSGKKLGGVVALSSFIPLHEEILRISPNDTLKQMPFLQCHGKVDPVVNYKFGEMSASVLKKFSDNHVFKSYPNLQHSSCDEEMDEVKLFLAKILPPM